MDKFDLKKYLAEGKLLKEESNNSIEFIKSMNPPTKAEIPSYQGIQNLDTTMENFVKKYAEKVRTDIDGTGERVKDEDRKDYLGDDVFSYLKKVLADHINSISDTNYKNFLKNPKVDALNDEKKVKEMKVAQEFINSIPDKSPTYVQNSKSFQKNIEEPFKKILKDITKKDFKDGNTIRGGFELFLLPHLAYLWKRHLVGDVTKNVNFIK
jgi:hypothetical protein